MSLLKQDVFRDEKWLRALREHRDIFTGQLGTEHDAIDPAHIGTLGRGIKSPDNEVLPLLHSWHVLGHQKGEMTLYREHAPDWLLRNALRLFAIEYHRESTGVIVPRYERKRA